MKIKNEIGKISMPGIFILMCLYTLYFASDFFIPITLAILLHLVLQPVMRTLMRIGLPSPLAAFCILICISGVLATAVLYLADPIDNWFRDLPSIARELQDKIAVLREPVETVTQASQKVQEIAEVQSSDKTAPEVVIKKPDLVGRIAATLPIAGVQILSTLILLFFFLSYSGEMRERVLQVLTRSGRSDLNDMLKAIEAHLSRYLASITAINIALGICVGVGMFVIDMPTPYAWGVMAALLNFVPYLGSLVGMAVVTLVALLSFDEPSHALLAPAIYMALTTLEGQVVTPAVLGRRLLVSPMIIFLAVAFWAWLWGPLGALLAVPIMIVLKIVADSVPSLQRLGHVIGRDPPEEAAR